MAFTKEQMAENIKRFEELLVSVHRDGIDRLLDFIRKSDFYKAPASTRFHSSCEGGLLYHTLQVYDCLQRKNQKHRYCGLIPCRIQRMKV